MNAKDIVSKEFDTVKRGGYDAAEVDTFLKDVSIEYKKLQNENEELEKKLEVLAEKIREYRKDEDALRDALLIAKKQGIAVVNEAKEDAEKIRKDAQEKAEKTIKDADALAAKKKELGEKNLAEANAKAKQTVDDAKAAEIHTIMMQQTEREQIVLQRTRKEVQDYTNKILAAYSAHIENIKAMPKACENEFVINTVKEVEARKPEDSAFAKKPAPAPAKPAPEAKPAPAPAKPAPEAKPAPAPEKKAEEKVTGESVLFSLKNEKEEKNAPTSELEFGKNK